VEAAWIEQLEEQVGRAASEIRRLREENRRLRELAEADGGPGAALGHWQEERDEVRQRVEKLADQLEGLLAGKS
jgi:ABC-type phosphate transport system auxiliary subunit